MRRCCIYFFYDRDGIVDRYVIYQIKDLVKNLDRLIFVSNGKLTEESRLKVEEATKEIIERENKGFDVWAYKEGIEYIGYDNLNNYDELILMNFTMYGPLYPFSEMFEEMDKRDLDFWGITKHHGFSFDPFGTISLGYIPEHIQSSFIVIRKLMLTSQYFKDYWVNMDMVNSYGESVGKHEAIFTYTFEGYGYKSGLYVETDDLKEYTHYPLMIEPLELIKNRKCPVFKRKSFSNEYYEFLNCTLGEPTVEMYEYIDKNFDYDLDMVWENLLRLENMADLKNRMHFNKVLPRDYVIGESSYKVALMAHIYFKDQIEYCLNYIQNMPDNCDIYITTDTYDKIEAIQKAVDNRGLKATIVKVENRGRDVSALLIGCKNYISKYDLICFIHDKKTVQFEPYTIGKSFAYKCFENTLGSKEYIKNIIKTFEEDKYLGIVMPPPPNHAAFYGILGTEWGSNFVLVKELLKKISINVNINEQKEPISPLGTMFWFRPNALKPLFDENWQYNDFPEEPNQNDGTILHAIERLYGFSSQSMGYYNAWCMHDKFTAIELTNYHFMLRELSMILYSKVGHQMGFYIGRYALQNFCNIFDQGKVGGTTVNNDRISGSDKLKEYAKLLTPPFLWNVLKRMYHRIKR